MGGKEAFNVSTEFNSSLFRLISLNKLIDDCNEYSRQCYFNGYNIEFLKMWKNTLCSIYRELLPKIKKKEERDKIDDLFDSASMIGNIVGSKNTPDGKVKTLDPSKFNKHWNLLDLIDRELRIIADKKGMLITNKANASFALAD